LSEEHSVEPELEKKEDKTDKDFDLLFNLNNYEILND